MSVQPTSLHDSSARVQKARARLKIYNRLTLGASIIGYVQMMYSGWFIVVGLLFLLVALISGGLALATMPKVKTNPFDYVLLSFLMLGCLFVFFSGAVQLIFLEQTNAYADCLNNAVTISGQEKCNVELKDSLLGNLIGTR